MLYLITIITIILFLAAAVIAEEYFNDYDRDYSNYRKTRYKKKHHDFFDGFLD